MALLGITHEEERTRAERECRPLAGVSVCLRLAAETPEDFCLQWVGVLELVDEDVAEALGQRPAHLVVVPQQVAGGKDQVVEVQQRRRTLVLAEACQDRLDQGHEIREHVGGDGLLKRRPRRAAHGIVGACQGVKPVGIGLSEPCLLDRRSPLPLLPIRSEGA